MSLLELVRNYDSIINAVIQPPRHNYTLLELGPQEMSIHKTKFRRTDLKLRNRRGYLIECSFFEAKDQKKPAPCIVFLHANGCSRVEAMDYLEIIASKGINLFCFDFSGSGKSEGPYCSLGWFEQEDLECVMEYLASTGRVSQIGIWGRSMGAITALLYAKRDSRISCLVLDSPFLSFKQFAKDFAAGRGSIPGFLTLAAVAILRSSVKSRANFDINLLDPSKEAPLIKAPALFATADGDTFVQPNHTRQLYDTYGGIEKRYVNFPGDHNSLRPEKFLVQVGEFLTRYMFASLNEKDISSPIEVEPKISAIGSQNCAPAHASLKRMFGGQKSVKYSFSWIDDQDALTQKNCVKSLPNSFQLKSKREISHKIEISNKYEEVPTENSPNSPNRTSYALTTAELSSKNNLKFTERKSTGKVDDWFYATILSNSSSIQSLSSKLDIQMPKNLIAQKSSLGANKNDLNLSLPNYHLPSTANVTNSEIRTRPTQKIIGITKSQLGSQQNANVNTLQMPNHGKERDSVQTGASGELKSNMILQKASGTEPIPHHETYKTVKTDQYAKQRLPLQQINTNSFQSVPQKVANSLILPPQNFTKPSTITQKPERAQEDKPSQSNSKYSPFKTSISKRSIPETYTPGMFNHLTTKRQENSINFKTYSAAPTI